MRTAQESKICFVILHYKVIDVTCECIESILNQDYSDYQIIVVDNHSDNMTYSKLVKKYRDNDKVHVISTEYNIGFAKANNIGYCIAKHSLKASLIVILNNDTVIGDRLFCKKLCKLSVTKKFDILGPDIITPAGSHQNPKGEVLDSVALVNKRILIDTIKYYTIPLLYWAKKKRGINTVKTIDYKTEKSNIGLHGSCLIYNESYVKHHEMAFFPNTFLYTEEDILYNYARKKGLKILYSPDLSILHKEDIATKAINSNKIDKRRFEIKHQIGSMKVLREILRDKLFDDL